MRKQRHTTLMLGISIMLTLLLIIGATLTVVTAEDSYMKTITWSGVHGSEHSTSECGGWHWILTPGGPATLTAGMLTGEVTVTRQVYNEALEKYENEDMDISFKAYNTVHGSGNGAMHFYLDWKSNELSDEDLAGGTIKNAVVHFDFTGTPRNQVLTISHVYCPESPPDPKGFISGIKYEVVNDGDPAYGEGWRIELFRGGGMIDWTLTGEHGYFEFNDLDLATYTIREKMTEDQELEWTLLLLVEYDSFEHVVNLTANEPSSTGNDFTNTTSDDSITLVLIKRIVQLDNDQEVDLSGKTDVNFDVDVSEDMNGDGNGEEMESFAGTYPINTGTNGSEVLEHKYFGIPSLVPRYMIEEDQEGMDERFELLRYEVRFFNEEGTQIGETEIEEDDSVTIDLEAVDVLPLKAEVTVVNQYTPPDDTTTPSDDPDPTPSTTTRTTREPTPSVTVEEPQITVIAPEMVTTEPAPQMTIVLDEGVPQAPPVLPQTGGPGPWALILSGLGISSMGVIFRRRLKEVTRSVTTLFEDRW